MNRREFVTSAACMASSALFVRSAPLEPSALMVIEKNGWRAAFAATGSLQSFTHGQTELVNQRLTNFSPYVLYPGLALNACDKPTGSTHTGESISFYYEFSDPHPIKVELHAELAAMKDGATGLRQRFVIDSQKSIASRVIVQLPIPLQLPLADRSVFLQ